MIENISYKNKLFAIIIRSKNTNKKGVNFISPKSFTHQVGFINHPRGYIIEPHTHKNFLRKINKTSEVLFVKSGVLRIDFYTEKRKYLLSKLLKKGDLVILNEGSHGFKVIKKCKLIEVKQGPFFKTFDKTRFSRIDEKKIKIKK